jgi:hypothetical protein
MAAFWIALMSIGWGELPPLPEIGHPETYYARQVARAERLGLRHAREANKVGQYITLGLGPRLTWEQKLRYFRHALRSHCVGPDVASNEVMIFYRKLADLVRQYAGAEAIRMASLEDDAWANQIARGVPKAQVKADAARFFDAMLGQQGGPPDHLNREDWEQLMILRKQWL